MLAALEETVNATEKKKSHSPLRNHSTEDNSGWMKGNASNPLKFKERPFELSG